MQFVPPPKSDEASRAQELANKCREQSKLETPDQARSHSDRRLGNKIGRNTRFFCLIWSLQHQEISQEISLLKSEVAMPPQAPPVVSGTTPVIEEVFDDDMGEEGDGKLSSDGMDQAVIPAEDNGAGVGFITVQPRQKVKKGGLKQKEARNFSQFLYVSFERHGQV